MGTKWQEDLASFDISRGFRQFQRADKAFSKGHDDSAVDHLKSGLGRFSKALNHLGQAEADAYNKASDEINKGNSDLQKSIDDYVNGKNDSAEKHYSDALAEYDKALDLLEQ